MVLSHSAIKRKRRSSWSSPPPVVQPPTTPPRTVRRKKPKSLGFLADQDPKLAGKTLTEARKINNARIAQIVARFAGTPPPLEPPHHKSHPVGLRVCVGTGVQNYKSIGKWVQYCDPNQDGSCHKNVKLIGNGIDEEVLLNTKPLTQYLFIHLEIGPHPGPGARTIKNSPLYAAARARLYGTLPPQEAPGPTVPQHEAGPSHSPKKEQMEIPLTDAQSCPSVDRHVIEISDDESGVHPVIVFAWVKNNTRYVETILIPNSDDYCFALNDFKIDLGSHGIECPGSEMEVFNPQIGQWVPLRWSEQLGPVQSPFVAYFIRHKGVKILPHFLDLLGLADGGGFPGVVPTLQCHKGKGRAA